ncbi:hypothetical protein ALQ58_200154 [Pseudomonas syringae pv. apii]|nr:hypothetical protein ALQ58_200154 [Pseudomonas syringae pv. apii]
MVDGVESLSALGGCRRLFRHCCTLNSTGWATPTPGVRARRMQACVLTSEKRERGGYEVGIKLKYAAMTGIRVGDQFAVGEPACKITRVFDWHHQVVFSIGDKHRLLDDREIGGCFLAPGAQGL